MSQRDIVKAFEDCGNIFLSAKQLSVIILNSGEKDKINHVTRALNRMIKYKEIEV